MTNFKNKSTGNLAFFTFFLGFAGSLARLATVMAETDDFLYLLQYVIGAGLNGTLVLQFLMYWNNKVEEASKQEKQATPKKQKKE